MSRCSTLLNHQLKVLTKKYQVQHRARKLKQRNFIIGFYPQGQAQVSSSSRIIGVAVPLANR